METMNDLAWKVIDHIVAKEFDGNKQALIDEVGNLNDYAAAVAEALERVNARQDDDLDWLANVIGM